MKSISCSLATAALILGVLAPAASAAPPPNDHNCAGVLVSGLAGPGFGGFVSSFAQQQLVDNFGFANCGQPPRSNP